MLRRRSFLKAGLAFMALWPGMHWLKRAIAQNNLQFVVPPTTHHVTENTATIYYWVPDTVTDLALILSEGDQVVRHVPLAETRASITLEDLTPATDYTFRIVSAGQDIAYYTDTAWNRVHFATQPFDWPVRFLTLGDSGFGDNITAQLAEHMSQQEADFFVHLGDIVYNTEEYAGDKAVNFAEKYFLPFQETLIDMPHYATIGNHDRDFATLYQGQSFYHWVFPPINETEAYEGQRLWYSFVMNDIRFLCLNTQCFFTDPGRQDQNAWLRERLAEDGYRTNIIFFHVPFRGSSLQHPNDGAAAIGDWEALFQEYRDEIGLVLSGHIHLYERLNVGGVQYLISGGGGYSIYERLDTPLAGSQALFSLAHYVVVELYEDHIRIEAFDINNTRIDAAEWSI